MRVKPESTITSLKLRASNLIVLVESNCFSSSISGSNTKFCTKTLKNASWKLFSKKKYARKMIVLLLTRVANQIRAFAIVY